ncbi:uncharacterized protein LOC120354261 [Nilaparvata lugens]|uniref:uncharacterized protein LOC120354261 n=1 Tax=Nilaparvata lugens TaxID=108931 RepID=UPI00193D25DA|nr:uncharacterized protein LOC120354261 [Nilaparvata lugens]
MQHSATTAIYATNTPVAAAYFRPPHLAANPAQVLGSPIFHVHHPGHYNPRPLLPARTPPALNNHQVPYANGTNVPRPSSTPNNFQQQQREPQSCNGVVVSGNAQASSVANSCNGTGHKQQNGGATVAGSNSNSQQQHPGSGGGSSQSSSSSSTPATRPNSSASPMKTGGNSQEFS